jgi:O-antigen/teichoic acid export membrane protein
MAESSPSPSVIPRIRQLAKHSLVYGVASIAQSFSSFLILPILVNRLSTEMFGAYSLLQMIVVFGQAIFALGITAALQRSYYDAPKGEARARVLSTSLFITLSSVACLLVLALGAGRLTSELVLKSPGYGHEVFLAALTAALMILNQFFLTYLRLQQASGSVAAVGVLTLLVQVAATWGLVVLCAFGLRGALWANIVTQGAMLVPLLWLARAQLRWAFVREEARLQLPYGIWAAIAGLGFALIDWSDRIVLEHQLSMRDVGIYSLSYRMASVINAVMIMPFAQIWAPVMMEYRTAPAIKSLFQRVFLLYVCFGAAAVVIGTFCMREILTRIIFKPEYNEAFGIVPIVMAAVLLYGLTNITSAGVSYARRLMPMVVLYYVVAGLRFAANWVVVPITGYSGAAWIALASYLALPVGIHWVARRTFAVEYPWARGLGLIAAALLAAIAIPRVPGMQVGALVLRGVLTVAAAGGIVWFGVGESGRASAWEGLRKLQALRRAPAHG